VIGVQASTVLNLFVPSTPPLVLVLNAPIEGVVVGVLVGFLFLFFLFFRLGLFLFFFFFFCWVFLFLVLVFSVGVFLFCRGGCVFVFFLGLVGLLCGVFSSRF